MSQTYHLYDYTQGGIHKNYRHWHTLKNEIADMAIVTEDPSKVTCPGCLVYLKKPRN